MPEIFKHKHPHITPFNGAFYDKEGNLHNLDGTEGPECNGWTNQTPFTGVFINSKGEPQDILELLQPGGVGGLPPGGTEGQVIAKNSDEDYDSKWIDPWPSIDGIKAIELNGALLSRTINGLSTISKSLFPGSTVFDANRTIINDVNGSIGVYISDVDSANILVRTMTTDTIAADEPTLLGNVYAEDETGLPQTIPDAEMIFGRTPTLEDYAKVITSNNMVTEWYITAIDDSGNITWGNPIPINTSDYQAQTAAEDAGKVLIGGATAGTFGTSLDIDTTPTQGSPNLISSGAMYDTINTSLVKSVNGRIGDVVLTKSDVGLSYVNNTSDADKPLSLATVNALSLKVDKVAGMGLSSTDFTQAEKDKLAALESSHFRGEYPDLASLQAITGNPGDFAYVDSTVPGEPITVYAWDSTDNTWVDQKGVTTAETPASIKSKYESNPDTNAYTDAEKAKLAGIEAGAQVNTVNSVNGEIGNVILDKADIGLDQVDNTSDLNKPVPIAVSNALANKVECFKLPASGTANTWTKIAEITTDVPSGDSQLIFYVHGIIQWGVQSPGSNMIQYSSRGSGYLANYSIMPVNSTGSSKSEFGWYKNANTGLTEIWMTRAPYPHETNIWVAAAIGPTVRYGNLLTQTTAPTGVTWVTERPLYTKSDLGLGNVDNTSDVNKPISTVTQTALDSKANVTDLEGRVEAFIIPRKSANASSWHKLAELKRNPTAGSPGVIFYIHGLVNIASNMHGADLIQFGTRGGDSIQVTQFLPTPSTYTRAEYGTVINAAGNIELWMRRYAYCCETDIFVGYADTTVAYGILDESTSEPVGYVKVTSQPFIPDDLLDGVIKEITLDRSIRTVHWVKIAEMPNPILIGAGESRFVATIYGIGDRFVAKSGIDILQICTQGSITFDVYNLIPTSGGKANIYGYVNNTTTNLVEIWIKRQDIVIWNKMIVHYMAENQYLKSGDLLQQITEPVGITYITSQTMSDDAATIKTKYESNTNTNAFTDAEKAKLALNLVNKISLSGTDGSRRWTKICELPVTANVGNSAANIILTLYAVNDFGNNMSGVDMIQFGTRYSIALHSYRIIPNNSGQNIRYGYVNNTTSGKVEVWMHRDAWSPGTQMIVDWNSGGIVGNLATSSTEPVGIIYSAIESFYSNPAAVKTAYESNTNTNAFTDAEKTKLSKDLVEQITWGRDIATEHWAKIGEFPNPTTVGYMEAKIVATIYGGGITSDPDTGVDMIEMSTRDNITLKAFALCPSSNTLNTSNGKVIENANQYGYVNNTTSGKVELWVKRAEYAMRTTMVVNYKTPADIMPVTTGYLAEQTTAPANLIYVITEPIYNKDVFKLPSLEVSPNPHAITWWKIAELPLINLPNNASASVGFSAIITGMGETSVPGFNLGMDMLQITVRNSLNFKVYRLMPVDTAGTIAYGTVTNTTTNKIELWVRRPYYPLDTTVHVMFSKNVIYGNLQFNNTIQPANIVAVPVQQILNTSLSEYFTTAEKTKLAGIETAAQVNTVDGFYLPANNGSQTWIKIAQIPSNTSLNCSFSAIINGIAEQNTNSLPGQDIIQLGRRSGTSELLIQLREIQNSENSSHLTYATAPNASGTGLWIFRHARSFNTKVTVLSSRTVDNVEYGILETSATAPSGNTSIPRGFSVTGTLATSPWPAVDTSTTENWRQFQFQTAIGTSGGNRALLSNGAFIVPETGLYQLYVDSFVVNTAFDRVKTRFEINTTNNTHVNNLGYTVERISSDIIPFTAVTARLVKGQTIRYFVATTATGMHTAEAPPVFTIHQLCPLNL